MAAPPIPLTPVDGVVVTTLVDNTSDLLLSDTGPVRRWGLAGTAGSLPAERSHLAAGGWTVDFLRAEHGFSAMIDVRADGIERRLLYDAGATPDGLIGNLDRMAIDPGTFEAIVFSHGHFDHVMGLHGLANRLRPRNLPVVLHPDFFHRRRIVGPGRVFELPTPGRSAIEGAGFTVVEGRQRSFLLDGRLLVTGQIDRVTDFEQGVPNQQAWLGGAWRPDPSTHDDQAVVLHVRNKGLVIITGCGHAGVVNTVRHAIRATGIDTVYALLGGLHLRDGPNVERTSRALADVAPAVLAPSHCTSWHAHRVLAAALPDAYYPNSVGSRYEL